ncbi:MAG TPA: DegV family protein [Candidatus Gallacutalibacter pullicola]|uniref:DegV family protein n=1 Tax=Candidatus Gallacutalibacter pullicola TaxID=2840830 RepID=A0A9D1DSD8_9FIRM|nr:DegV family protein [Candidatus Gallacutalibacter pullicola]
MKEYVILTDATCDLSPELLDEMGIGVIPMEFEMGGEIFTHYPDARQMGLHEFYDRIRQGQMPKTTQINRSVYEKYFGEILSTGRDILYVCFSSGLSGTYQASRLVAEEMEKNYPGSRIVIVDSRAASVGEGMLALAAVQEKEKGLSIDEVASRLESLRDHVCHWFMVDDLNHLHRGGRVSAMTAFAGSALGIKPILRVDEKGELPLVHKVRGRKKGMEKLLEIMENTITDPENQTVYIVHADCPEDAKELRRLVKSKVHAKEYQTVCLGPIIGTHTGPGLLALIYFGTEK